MPEKSSAFAKYIPSLPSFFSTRKALDPDRNLGAIFNRSRETITLSMPQDSSAIDELSCEIIDSFSLL